MPTYQYKCTDCGTPLEVVQSFSDDALTICPTCSGKLRKVFSPVGVVFKGSGFYRTDSRDSGRAKASTAAETAASSDKAPAAESGKSGDAAKNGSSGTGDSKPAAGTSDISSSKASTPPAGSGPSSAPAKKTGSAPSSSAA